MAKEISVVLKAHDDATATIRGVTHSIEGMKTPLLAVGGIASALGLVSLGRHLVDGARSAIKEAEEQQNAEANLAQALRNTGRAVESELPRLRDKASALQLVTGIEDDQILTSQSLLVTLGRLSGEGLDRATLAALNLGTVTGQMDAAFKAVAKAAGGNFAPLQKLGIVIDEGTPKAQKFEVALKKLEAQFGGQAAASAATFSGKLKIIGTELADLQKTLGDKIIDSPAVAIIFEEISNGIRELQSQAQSSDIEGLIREISVNFLDFAEAGISVTRTVVGLAGSIDLLFTALRGGDTAAVRELFNNVDGTIGTLLGRIDTLQARLTGSAAPARAAAAGLDAASAATKELAAGTSSLRDELTPANAVLGLVAASAGVKLYGGLRRAAAGALDSVGAMGEGTKAMKRFQGEVLRTLPVMDSWELATTRQKLAVGGLAVGVGVLSYTVTRLVADLLGIDEPVRKGLDAAMNGFDAASGAARNLELQIGFIEKAMAKAEKQGIHLEVDTAKLQAAKDLLDKIRTGGGTQQEVIDLVVNAQPLIAEINNAAEGAASFGQAMIRAGAEGVTSVRGLAGPFRDLEDRANAVTLAVELITSAAEKASLPIQTAGGDLSDLDELLQSVGSTGFAKLRADAEKLEEAFRLVQASAGKSLSFDEAAAKLDELRKKGRELEKLGIEVDFVQVTELQKALDRIGVKPIEDLKREAQDLERAYAAVQERFNAGLLPPTEASAVLKEIDARAKALEERGIVVPFRVETPDLTGLKALDDLNITPLDERLIDRAALASAVAYVNQLEIDGPQTEEAAREIAHLKREIASLAPPDFEIPGLTETERQTYALDRALKALGLDTLSSQMEQAADSAGALQFALDFDFSALGIDPNIADNIRKQIGAIRDAATGADDLGTISFAGITLPNFEQYQAAVDQLASIDAAYAQSRIDAGLATSEEILQGQLDQIDQWEANEKALAGQRIGDKQLLEDALTRIHQTAENKRLEITKQHALLGRAAQFQTAAAVLSSLATIVGASGRQFRIMQGLQIAATIANTAGAIMVAMAPPNVYPNTLIQAAVAAAVGAAQLATIRAQKAPGLAVGGFASEAASAVGQVPGASSGRDTVPAMLSPKELVIDERTSSSVIRRFEEQVGGAATGPGGRGLTETFRRFLVDGESDRAPFVPAADLVPGGRGITPDFRRMLVQGEPDLPGLAAGGFVERLAGGGSAPQGIERSGVGTVRLDPLPGLPVSTPRTAFRDESAELVPLFRELLEIMAQPPEFYVSNEINGDIDPVIRSINTRVRNGTGELIATDVVASRTRG